MKTINTTNVNINNSLSHLEALLKQREEMQKKISALDAEIKETRKTIEVKRAVLALQEEYAAKAAALKKEYDDKIKALVGDDNTPGPDPQPESPKPQAKASVKETVAPKAAPVAKKVEEKKPATAPAVKAEAKPAEAPKTVAPAPKKEEKVASATATPSEKKEAAKAHNKSQFLHEISIDDFQKVINNISKEEAGEAILHATLDGTKEQFATLSNAILYGYQCGVKKFWFTYSEPEYLDAVSEEMAAVLEAGQKYGFTIKVTQRRATSAAKADAPQSVKTQRESSAKADRAAAAAPKASEKKQKAMAVNPDGFRAWTLANAAVVDGSDEI